MNNIFMIYLFILYSIIIFIMLIVLNIIILELFYYLYNNISTFFYLILKTKKGN